MPHDPSNAAPASLGTDDGSAGCGGHCTCGGADTTPVLDVRALPPAIRHDAVLGSLAGLPVGGALVLAAPHQPLPLLAELDDREPGHFDVTYDATGPETWLVRLTRRSR